MVVVHISVNAILGLVWEGAGWWIAAQPLLSFSKNRLSILFRDTKQVLQASCTACRGVVAVLGWSIVHCPTILWAHLVVTGNYYTYDRAPALCASWLTQPWPLLMAVQNSYEPTPLRRNIICIIVLALVKNLQWILRLSGLDWWGLRGPLKFHCPPAPPRWRNLLWLTRIRPSFLWRYVFTV